MFNAFKKSIAAGGPAYHLAEYTVIDNPYQAVHGGWKVRTKSVCSCTPGRALACAAEDQAVHHVPLQ